MMTEKEKPLEAQAVETLEAAKVELATAQENLQKFVSEHFRATAGGLIYVVAAIDGRGSIDLRLRALVLQVESARDRFHVKLAEWAAFQDTTQLRAGIQPKK